MMKVANGNTLVCNKCHKSKWYMQGEKYKEDFLILTPVGADAVLGTIWLSKLNDIAWNFRWLTISFVKNGRWLQLKG